MEGRIMGYRSTVAYTIRFVPPDKDEPEKGLTTEHCKATFFTFIAEAKSNDDTAMCFQDEHRFKVDEENLTITFFAEGVKWYDSYADVKFHEALVDLSREWADDGDCSNSYIGGAFARIGDDTEDTAEDCWGQGDYEWCCVRRFIEWGCVRRFIECDWVG
jgi:hypothetical protein